MPADLLPLVPARALGATIPVPQELCSGRGFSLRLIASLFALLLMAPAYAQQSALQDDAPAETGPPVAAVEGASQPVDADPVAAQAPDPADQPPDPSPEEGALPVAPESGADPAEADTTNPAQTAQDARTPAERDFDSLYGQPYDPVADPTLPAPASITASYDPWERYNRQMHRFNNVVDRRIALPLAQTYVRIVPRPVRLGVSNFFSNLGQPVSAVNSLLQGKPKQAAQALGRFALNTTVGLGGFFDPATSAKLPNKSEDFGQTLGVWGWQRSRYVELPLFGPRTVRDVVGLVGDSPLSPLRQVGEDSVRVSLQGLQLVEVRTQLLSTDSLREGVIDDYALVRDAWLQRRNYQIFGDRLQPGEEELPEYLRNETNPIIPVGAMPVGP